MVRARDILRDLLFMVLTVAAAGCAVLGATRLWASRGLAPWERISLLVGLAVCALWVPGEVAASRQSARRRGQGPPVIGSLAALVWVGLIAIASPHHRAGVALLGIGIWSVMEFGSRAVDGVRRRLVRVRQRERERRLARLYEGRQCGICGRPFDAGAPFVQCPDCHVWYHEHCWGRSPFCTTDDCPNAARPAARAEVVPALPVADLPARRAVHNIGVCPYCQWPVGADEDHVTCPACDATHHSDCWQENSGCAVFGCPQAIHTEAPPERVEPEEATAAATPGKPPAPPRAAAPAGVTDDEPAEAASSQPPLFQRPRRNPVFPRFAAAATAPAALLCALVACVPQFRAMAAAAIILGALALIGPVAIRRRRTTATAALLLGGVLAYTFVQPPVKAIPLRTDLLSRHVIGALALSPNGRMLTAVGCDVNSTRLASTTTNVTMWDVQTGSLIRAFQIPNHALKTVALSADGRVLATAGFRYESNVKAVGQVKLWDTATGRCIWTLTVGKPVIAVAFRPDGGVLATGELGGDVRLWSLWTGELLDTMADSESAERLAFSPDGYLLAAARAGEEGDRRGVVVRTWEMGWGGEYRALTAPDSEALGTLRELSFSRRGDRLLAVRRRSSRRLPSDVWVWDTFQVGEPWSLDCDGRFAWAGLVLDGQYVAATLYEGYYSTHVSWLGFWDARTGKLVSSLRATGVQKAALTPDGTRLALADRYGRIAVYRLRGRVL